MLGCARSSDVLPDAHWQLRNGNVTLNLQTGKVYFGDQPVSLTAHELKLLNTLMLRPDVVHGKTELAEKIYGYHDERDSNTLEVFIAQLRQKLGASFIKTVRGRGLHTQRPMIPRSLTFRTIAAGVIWIIVALSIGGWVILNVFSGSASHQFEARRRPIWIC